jgi:AcrR family transcriptional regulator
MYHDSMMSARQEDPRANQKARTRTAIIDAARRLQDRGLTPTVAAAARDAKVSRATAYRYFPTQQALLIELGAERTYQPVEQHLAQMTSPDVEERLLSLIDAYQEAFEHDEPRIRMALGVYQDTWLRAHRDGPATPPRLRQGRRMRWLDTVLQPLALPDDRRQQLKTALALAVGPDSHIILKDVCGLSSTQAAATLRRAALALLRAELREQADPRT